MTHLLDTSALLVFLLGEPGADHVQALFDDERNSIAASVLTKSELWARLKSLGSESKFGMIWAENRKMFEAILPVTEDVAEASNTLRERCANRIPMADALIAATAIVHGLTLVHRDAHMQGIPARLLRQIDLSKTRTG